MLAFLTGYYVLRRIQKLPDWYVRDPQEFRLPPDSTRSAANEVKSSAPTLMDSMAVQTETLSLHGAPDKSQVPNQSPNLNPATLKPNRSRKTADPRRVSQSLRRSRRHTAPKQQTISEAELPLILVNSLEDSLNRDIRHGIRAIRTQISTEKLQIESVLDVNYLNSIPQIQSDPLWKYMQNISGDELYVMIELIPRKSNIINQLSSESKLTIGEVTLSLSQVERMTGISIRELMKTWGLPEMRLSSGVLVMD